MHRMLIRDARRWIQNRPHMILLDSFIHMWNKRVQRTKRNVGVTFYLGHATWYGYSCQRILKEDVDVNYGLK